MGYKNKDGIFVVSTSFSCDRFAFDGKASDIKAYIDSVVEKAKNEGMVGEGNFLFESVNDYYSDATFYVSYHFERTETEREKASREAYEAKLAEEAANKQKKAYEKRKLRNDAEYQEFLRLKQKFKGLL